jgi:hypothetical protein
MTYITNEISNLSSQPSIETDLNKMTLSDVGQSLFQKLTLGADGYLGCQALIDKYEQQDTHKLLVSIHEGLRTKRIDVLQSSASELSEVLDNIWNDRKISRLSSGISFGMPLLLGTVGPLVAQSIGGASGILAGLGFRVFDKTITPVMTKTISKGSARVFKNDYLLAIYEFKKIRNWYLKY